MMSAEEQRLLIDHDTIRGIGQSMAGFIGALAAETIDRQAALEALNSSFEQVPYDQLFAESDQLAEAIEGVNGERQEISAKLDSELERLDSLGGTFASRKPDHSGTAQKLVDQKKAQAQQTAEEQQQPLDEQLAGLEAESGEVDATIELVGAAWPVEPYSEEVLEAAAEWMEQSTMGESTEDEVLESSTPKPRRRRPEPAKEKAPGPYAELASQIPSLMDRLEGFTTEHFHVYDEIETARQVLDRAAAKPAEERTEEEDNLTRAIFVLRRRFLADPNDLSFLDVYEAKDIFELAQRLNKFSRKNRPDFNELEGQILDRAAVRIPLTDRRASKEVEGATERMKEDNPRRRGMTWRSLVTHANRACDAMRVKLFPGGPEMESHLRGYVVEVVDRSDKAPDLSWVFQFVADDFAFDILARRRSDKQTSNHEKFMSNCEITQAWLEEARGLLEQMPSTFRLTRYHKPKANFSLVQKPRATYEGVAAMTSIANMISDIEVRRTGDGSSRAARHKPVGLDPSGALKHQLRLGHMVDRLKEELTTYDAPSVGHTEEIKPFE